MKAVVKTGLEERQHVVATLHGVRRAVESSGLDVHFRADLMKLVLYGSICSNTGQESMQMPVSVLCGWKMK